ncbi:hypothetical protein LG201_03720 [Methylobacillus gramineus]|uniref:hypothetical protein n=1 Tax=Methylobacillus gramineus TaxID=755169 RepID=UPI001CFFC8E2|nr:hypothetical protein [Methylobacillus gramineus]MCB5184306.1 hypothetical protein [Methylobacillus gramineus]
MNTSSYLTTVLSSLNTSSYTSQKNNTAESTEGSASAPSASTIVSLSSNNKTGYVQSEAARELEEYMNMSDSERLQWHWLNSHGISKEDFNNMSAEDKQKIVDQMREELKQKMNELPSSKST